MATQMLSLRATTTHLRGVTMTLGIGLALALFYRYQASLRGEAQDLFILRWAVGPWALPPRSTPTPRAWSTLVGASGASAALMGAALVAGRLPFALKLVFVAWLTMQVAEFVASFNSYDWIEGGMAFWSHAGGLVVGLIVFGARAADARK